MGQTVNLLSSTSVVRIHLPPPAQKFPPPFRFRLRRKLHSGGNFFAFHRDSLRWTRGGERRRMRGGFGRFDWDQLHRLRFALSSSSGPKFRLLAEQFGWAGISFLPFYVGTRLAGGCVPLVFSSTMSLELVNTVRIAYMFDSVKRETQDSCKNS